MGRLSKTRGGGPQSSGFYRLKGSRHQHGPAVQEIPPPPIQEWRHRSSNSRGGCGWWFSLIGSPVAPPVSTVGVLLELVKLLDVLGFLPPVRLKALRRAELQ